MEQHILTGLAEKYPVTQLKEVNQHLVDEVKNWEKSVHRKLKVSNPFYDNQERYARAKDKILTAENRLSQTKSDLNDYVELSKFSDAIVDIDFWSREIRNNDKALPYDLDIKESDCFASNKVTKKVNSDLIVLRKLLLKTWGKALCEEYCKWEISEIQRHRKGLFEKLEE